MLIRDINTAGDSNTIIVSNGGPAQLLLNGTWNGGTVSLKKLVPETNQWVAVESSTADDYYIIESVGGGKYKTSTTHGGSAPDLVAEVIFNSPSDGFIKES